MSDKSISALMRASEKAATDNVQHFVIAVNGDGGFEVHGSSNIINGPWSNQELYNQLKLNIIENLVDDQPAVEIAPMIVLNYPLLPCSPYSDEWKGSKMIRRILSKMIDRAGFGRSGRRQSLGKVLRSYNLLKPLRNKIGLLLCHSHIKLRLWLRLS